MGFYHAARSTLHVARPRWTAAARVRVPSCCMTWAAARRNAAANRWGRGKEGPGHHLWNRSVIQTSGSGFDSGSGSGSGRGSSTQESDPFETAQHRAQAARRGKRRLEENFDAVARRMGQVRNNVRCGWMGRKTLRWDTVMRLC